MKKHIYLYTTAVAVAAAIVVIGVGGCNNDTSESHDNVANYLGRYDAISYGGQIYRTVKIGNQLWMAENMNYEKDSSWCYDNADSNCVKYGRLYDWETAKTVCPSGWHLPLRDDWDALGEAVGGTRGELEYESAGEIFTKWEDAGNKLKTKSGWKNGGNGNDDFGFSALPGGGRYEGGRYAGTGSFPYDHHGTWWTAEESSVDNAYAEYVASDIDWMGEEGEEYKFIGYSVRCLKDN